MSMLTTQADLQVMSGKRDLNPRPPPWQGGALPLSYSRDYYRPPGLRAKGLEPPHLAALDPKSSVSTNSTTLAFCTPERIRTSDARIRSPTLYPTELRAHIFARLSTLLKVNIADQTKDNIHSLINLSNHPKSLGDRRGLNPRPLVPQTRALPTELRSPYNRIRRFRQFGALRQIGFEPMTDALEGRCSIQLSYWRLLRTIARFGMTGFEPATLGSQNRCATTALHPV